METTSDPKATEANERAKSGLYNGTMLIQEDGSTEEGSALHEPKLLEAFSSFTHILSEAGIGPVIAWGEIAMMFHGIPICFTKYHVLIPDDRFEDARKALLAEGYVVEQPGYVRYGDLGAPCCEMHNSRRPELFSKFLILGLSAVQPAFDDIDITEYKQIGGIAFPPLFALALSLLHALSRSKVDHKGLGLRLLLKCWCGYTKTLGYKPLGRDAMKGQPLDEKLLSFWVGGMLQP